MSKENDNILTEAKDRFKRAREASEDNRRLWEEDVKFARLGEQWPEAIKKQREQEGRPCLTINRLPAFIKQVVNDARMNTPSIKVHPVDDVATKDTADILNGLIRNIEYSSDADVAYDTALECGVTGGFGYFRIELDYAHDDTFDLDIKLSRIVNPLTVDGDADSEACDASDWKYGFISDLIKKDEYTKRWKNSEKVDWDDFAAGDDRPNWIENDNVRIAEYWKREEIEDTIVKLSNGVVMKKEEYDANAQLMDVSGITVVDTRETKSFKVTQYIVSGAEVLETNKWPGKYIPIIPVYGDEVFVGGKRHLLSLIRFAKDAQRMFNYWRTTSTELVALAPKTPYIGPKGAFSTDSSKWETANSATHPYIEYDGAVPPQRQGFDGPPAGALQEAMNSSDDMKSIMGLYDASLGAKSNETSGKAILARQREGDIGAFNFIDNLSRALKYAGRVIVDLIPKVYDKERIIRVIHEDETTKNVPVNRHFDEEGISKIYDLTVGKYDITVEAGPSFTTKREESANQMMELMRTFPQSAAVIGDLVAKNLDWPGADQIAERLKAMLPPQILKMEGKQGIPPQAQAVIGQMDEQIKQMHQQMQQGMQLIHQLKQENESLKMDNAANSFKVENDAAKITVDQDKLSVEREKIASNERIKAAEIEAEKEKMLLELAAGLMSAPNTQSIADDTNMDEVAQQPDPLAGLQDVMQAIQGMAAALSAPKYINIIRDANGIAVGASHQVAQ